jgi:hypothetical protein
MNTVRLWHSYMGFFMAPSVLFFSLTGAAQLFSLHESHGEYQPPAIVEKLSSVHKDQVFALGDHHARPDSASDANKPSGEENSSSGDKNDGDKIGLPTLMLKVFCLLVALCLAFSTGLGLWIGLSRSNRKRIGWTLVGAGSLIPAILLLI